MLGSWLSVALLALLPPLVLLFTPVARSNPSTGRTGVLAVLIAAVAASGSVLLLGRPVAEASLGAALLVVGVLAWVPVCRAWSPVGVMAWGVSVWVGLLYLAYMLVWTARAELGFGGTAVGLLLWLLEGAAFLLGAAYLWEMVDVLGRRAWVRRGTAWPQPDDDSAPFVSLHVPAHNEPPEMVIETLTALLALDYPHDRYEVHLIDDNTSDESLWRPVEAFCAEHPHLLRFHHLDDWPGFKSGALNYALTVTSPQAEVIGIVDADYVVSPDYLRATTGAFLADPRLAFLQTPQDYRDWRQSAYYRRLYYSYSYFFEVSQISRDERDAAIFGGTMGLIRRDALVEVGGWDEWCITEDAELSLRLLRAGWSGRHVDRSFGTGVMPLTFDALKRQRYRWCFGGIQILRMHHRSLLPGRRPPSDHLRPAQRWAYLSGALQWFGDVVGLLFFLFLLASAFDLVLGGGLVFRRLSGFLLAAIPVLVVVSLGRSLALLRRATGASWGDAAGAFGIWLALGWTVAVASVRGATASAGVFLRTPKTRGEGSWWDAARANPVEATLASAGAVGMALLVVRGTGGAAALLVALLALPVAGFAAAPANTVAALRAELPDELRRRRRTERMRAWAAGPLRPARVAGATALVVTGSALAVVLLSPTTATGPGQDILGDLGVGPRPTTGQPTPGTASPTSSPSTEPSGPGTSGTSTAAPSATPLAGSSGGGPTSTSTAAPPAGSPGTGPTSTSTATPPPTTSGPTGSPTPTSTFAPSPTATGTPLPTPTVSQRPTSTPTARPSVTRPTPTTASPSSTRRP